MLGLGHHRDERRTRSRQSVCLAVPTLAVAAVLLLVISTSSTWNAEKGNSLLRDPKTTFEEVVLEVGAGLVAPATSIDSKAADARPEATTTAVLHLHRDEDWPVPTLLDDSARYLSYLPHSGFHNQR